MRTPVHILGGSLGTGKTTALQHLLGSTSERVAVVVNDFGTAAIDATLLGEGYAIQNIAGGCVCCTAPAGLAPAIRALLDDVRPDRIYIEPSGLARPADLVDMIERGPDAARIERMPVVVLVDPAADLDGALVAEQLASADVVVANRCDLAGVEQIEGVRARVAGLWPPPLRLVETSFGRLSPADLAWGDAPAARPPAHTGHDHAGHDHAGHDHAGHGRTPSTEGHTATSDTLDRASVYSLDALVAVLASTPGLVRFKGLFRTDAGWMRLDRAGDRTHLAPTPWRRDSRYDAIFTDAATDTTLADRLAACVVTPDSADETPAVRLIDPSGTARRLTRTALAALPGQVPDIAVLVPGREGAGVYLREVLTLLGLPDDTPFVVAAADGMTTAPTPVGGAGEAVLLHSLGDGPLPASQAGPFRILGPSGAGRTACANVKQVTTIRALGS